MNYQDRLKFTIVALIASIVAFFVSVTNAIIVLNRHHTPETIPSQVDLTDICTAFERWKQITGDDEPGMSKRCKQE